MCLPLTLVHSCMLGLAPAASMTLVSVPTCQANLAEALLPGEKTASLEADTAREVARRLASRLQRVRDKARLCAKLEARYPGRLELARATLLVEPGTPLPSTWHHRVSDLEMRAVDSATMADVIVAHNPWELNDQCHLWAVVLRGAWVGTAALLDPTPSGPCRKIKAALKTKRRLFVSDGFRSEHCHLWAALLEVLIGTAGHHWELLDGPGAWAYAKAKVMRRGNSAEVLSLLSAAEAQTQLPHDRHIFGPSEFINFLMHDDGTTGALGLGDM